MLARPLDLTLDIDRRQFVVSKVARGRDRDQRPEVGLGPQADGAPVVAGAETGEQDLLRGRERCMVLRIGQQFPAQWMQLGGTRTNEQLYPQELVTALDGRLDPGIHRGDRCVGKEA